MKPEKTEQKSNEQFESFRQEIKGISTTKKH